MWWCCVWCGWLVGWLVGGGLEGGGEFGVVIVRVRGGGCVCKVWLWCV